MSTHKGAKLLANSLERTQTVVLGKSTKEVLEDIALVTGDLEQLLNDLLLVGGREGGGADDAGELAVSLEGLVESKEGAGGLVEGSRFGRGSVLSLSVVSFLFSFFFCIWLDALSSNFLVVGSTETTMVTSSRKRTKMQTSAEQKNSYQSSGIGAGNTKQGHRGLDLLGRSVGPQAVEGGSARDGELLGSGTQAGAGELSGKHGKGSEFADVKLEGTEE